MVEIFDHIRKLYQFRQPCEELAQYIEFFSETNLDATSECIHTANFTVKLFPSYTPTIWINLGSAYHLKNGNTIQQVDKHTDVLLLRNEIVERNNLPTDNVFTIKFVPGGFEAVLGISQAKIGSNIVDAHTVVPASVFRKIKRLDGFEQRTDWLQKFFLEQMAKRKKDEQHLLNCVKETVEAFTQSGMGSSNTELAKQLYVTDKTLYRYFTQVVGTNPKNYLSTVRARTALTAYVSGKDLFSPYEHGYYDMSHFYKDVVKFTGHKLSAYRTGNV